MGTLTDILDSVKDLDWRRIRNQGLLVAGGVLLAGGLLMGLHLKDRATKRQTFPVRGLQYQVTEQVEFRMTGASAGKKAATDEVSESGEREVLIQKYSSKIFGDDPDTKVGNLIGETTDDQIGRDVRNYNIYNERKDRIATSTTNPERFQAFWVPILYPPYTARSVVFTDQTARILKEDATDQPSEFKVYTFHPEWGRENISWNIITQKDGTRILHSSLTTVRSWLLGYFFGEDYRNGTLMEKIVQSERNKPLIQEILRSFEEINRVQDASTRRDIYIRLVGLHQRLEKVPVYRTFEDGIIDWLPQESTIYLGEDPSWWKRLKTEAMDLFTFGKVKDCNVLRVEQLWDFWPGYFSGLHRWVSLGSGEDTLRPFNRVNHGGYKMTSCRGDLAEIRVQDFFQPNYANDLLYVYRLDLNGDGRLTDDETIGKVLVRFEYDSPIYVKDQSGTHSYSKKLYFMAGQASVPPEEAFKLAAYLETMVPDQHNRGFLLSPTFGLWNFEGNNTHLGFINTHRSSVLLYNTLQGKDTQNTNVEELSRALTEESILVAPKDIVRLLRAAKHPLAGHLEQLYFGPGGLK